MQLDFPVVENNWLEKHEAILESYVERIFEANTFQDMFNASHWYVNAVTSLNLPSAVSR